MPKKNDDQPGGITQENLLTTLEQSGRPAFTKRRLTQLTSEGLLPKLKRTSLPGSNRPVYLWKPGVIEQATYLYDVLERGTAHHQVFLALWLAGYEVPFEPLLQHWLRPIDTLLHNLTGEAQDPDEAVDEINSRLVTYSAPTWKFSPRPDDVIREVGVENWTELMTVFFGMLAVPGYEPDELSYEGTLRTLQNIERIAQSKGDPEEGDPEELFSWLLLLQDVFLLPRYKEVLINATTEEWMQARTDYRTLCQLLHKVAALFPRRNARLTPEMRQRVFLHWGGILPPFFLAVRHAAYGDRIDEALLGLSAILNDILTDPDMGKRLAKM